MTNRRKRRDANHQAIVEAFKALGWSVVDTSQVGGAVCDLIVARSGRTVAVEIKTQRGALKPEQREWLASWPSEIAVVRCIDDVERISRIVWQDWRLSNCGELSR